jgi:hypothetical protein
LKNRGLKKEDFEGMRGIEEELELL